MLLEAMQAAQQAAVVAEKSGISIFLSAGTVGLILTNSGLLVKAFLDRKAVKKVHDEETATNPCDEHGRRIDELEKQARIVHPEQMRKIATLEANYLTTAKTIDDMRKENREDHQMIFEAIRNK
jgi:hypothetical protein